MYSLLILPFISLPMSCLAQAPALASGCPSVHIIASRATGEPPGEGIIGSLADDIQQMVPGTTSEALNYPATMPYSGSIPIGVTNLKAAIANNTAACPSTKLILMGYSQGAAVTVDTLCGGGGADIMAPVTPGLTAQEGNNVIAAVMMGDPRFVPGVSYEAGTNMDKPGVAERDPTAAQCPTFATRMISFCDTNDSRCASGNSSEVHATYLDRYTQQATAFIMSKIQAPTTPAASPAGSEVA